MTFVNKLSKSFHWLRWSTLFAILFYMFFIGLILHSTSYKLQHTLRTRHSANMPQELIHKQQLIRQKPNGELTDKTLPGNKGVYTSNSNSNSNNNNNHHHNNASKDMEHKITSNAKPAVNIKADDMYGVEHNLVKSSEPETVILAASSVNEQMLAKAFKRADRNRDEKLTIQELAVYLNYKIVEHIDNAIMNNAREFKKVDISPADGLITWNEYHRFFLREHGMTEVDIDEHDEIKHTALNRKAREDMMRDKARWSEAARTDLFTLTIDEYLSFRHPESSISNLLELVDDLLRQFDQDGDDQLTIEEFSELNVNDDDDLMRKSLISKTVVERREEFKRIVDKNHDEKADRGELLNYVNPKTPRFALQEAATLFSLCDENKDGQLTLDELIANAEIFLPSKMIDTANSFHNEF